MRPPAGHVVIIVAAAIAIASTGPAARAEPFVAAYGGGAFTHGADVETQVAGFGTVRLQDASFRTSPTGGGRVGFWLPRWPFVGVAVDTFYFTTNLGPQRVQACNGNCATISTTETSRQGHLAISLDLMLRLRLQPSEEFPHGRIMPYLTVGPAFVRSTWNEPGFTEAQTVSVGVKGGGGATVMLTHRLALFAEYRVTSFEPEQDFTADGLAFTAATRLTTHHLIGGLSFHFN